MIQNTSQLKNNLSNKRKIKIASINRENSLDGFDSHQGSYGYHSF